MAIEQLFSPKTPPKSLTVSEAIDEFMLHQRTMRHTAKTIRYYNYSLGKLSTWMDTQDIEAISDIDGSLLRRFALTLSDSGLSDQSAHGILSGVRALFMFLENEELIQSNPMKRVKMPKVEKKILPAFTDAEVKKLLAVCEGSDFASLRNRLLVRLLLDSGLRLAECATLKVGTIDSQTGIMKVMGKGRKERVTRIGAETLRVLRKYLRAYGAEDGEPLWIGRRGPMTPAGISETLEKIGAKAKVHSHPHKFRRTCAIRLLRNGADVFSVQLLLGHSDIAVLRRYLAQSEEDVLGVHERCTL